MFKLGWQLKLKNPRMGASLLNRNLVVITLGKLQFY